MQRQQTLNYKNKEWKELFADYFSSEKEIDWKEKFFDEFFLHVISFKEAIEEYLPFFSEDKINKPKDLYPIYEKDKFWKTQVQLHFPQIAKKFKKPVIWFLAYAEAYATQYFERHYYCLQKEDRELFTLIKCGHVDKILSLKICPGNLFHFDKQELTAPQWANHFQHQQVLDHFYKCVTTELSEDDNKYYRTPLHWAAICRQDIIVFLSLMENDITEINLHDDAKHTPLYYAAEIGHKDAVNLLLKSGAKVESESFMDCSPLIAAATHGHFEVAKILVEAKANINYLGWNNETAIFAASRNGHTEIVKFLLQKGAEINVKKLFSETIFECAANPIIKNMLQLFQEINALNKLGMFGNEKQFNQLKLNAAFALKRVVIDDEDKSILEPHLKLISETNLEPIYSTLKPMFKSENKLLQIISNKR